MIPSRSQWALTPASGGEDGKVLSRTRDGGMMLYSIHIHNRALTMSHSSPRQSTRAEVQNRQKMHTAGISVVLEPMSMMPSLGSLYDVRAISNHQHVVFLVPPRAEGEIRNASHWGDCGALGGNWI